MSTPLIIGHRGASGHALENSLEAFRLCVENGLYPCDGVELDIHTTASGDLVVHHDAHLVDGREIAALSTAEVRGSRLSNGEPVPTLEEALEVLAPIQVFIEAKTLPAKADHRLLSIIRAHPFPEQLHVHAFDHRIIRRLHTEDAALSLGVLSASYPLDSISPVLMAGARTLWQEWHLIDEDLVARANALDIKVIAWTVNDSSAAARLAGMGVAGVCGNYPERLVRGQPS